MEVTCSLVTESDESEDARVFRHLYPKLFSLTDKETFFCVCLLLARYLLAKIMLANEF